MDAAVCLKFDMSEPEPNWPAARNMNLRSVYSKQFFRGVMYFIKNYHWHGFNKYVMDSL